MTPKDNVELKKLFQTLRDRPLNLMEEDDRKLYEPLHDADHDLVPRLFRGIEFSEQQSVQLVAGFRGTGKTTELSRLEKMLWEQGYLVISVDLDEYVDMYSPIDVRDFLLILAGAVSERLTDERLLGVAEGVQKGFWERIRGLVPNGIEVKEAGIKLPIGDIKVALKTDRTFRDRIRDAFDGRLGELVEAVRQHHRSVLEALRKRAGRDVQLVVIVDSLEHLRGKLGEAKAVRTSVQELFLSHADAITLPDTHVVMSVPAFLVLQADNLAAQYVNGQVQAWPAYRVQDQKGNRTEVVDRMIRLVEKRGDYRRILPDQTALEKLILASGGHLRDMLNMLIEAIYLADRGVGQQTADKVISIARRAYMPLYKDEIEVLRPIAETQDVKQLSTEQQDYLLRFLDAGLVLCYLNDEFWYDVHPLIRSTVLKS